MKGSAKLVTPGAAAAPVSAAAASPGNSRYLGVVDAEGFAQPKRWIPQPKPTLIGELPSQFLASLSASGNSQTCDLPQRSQGTFSVG